MKTKVQWQKNLYERYGVPDNYTDSSFLENLRKNIKPNNVTLSEALTLGASISVKINVVVLFVIVFVALYNDWMTPSFTFAISAILTGVGYFIYNLKVCDFSNRLPKDIKTVLIFLSFGYILSPVLKTLTETISTDTIYAMTIIMFLTHLIFDKYGPSQISLSDSLSITSSIFGSLMLASRLTTSLHAFTLLTFSVECFVLLPFLLSQIKHIMGISVILLGITIYILFLISQTLTYILVLVNVFIHGICPVWYVRCQKYKDNIYGPWDEAVISS